MSPFDNISHYHIYNDSKYKQNKDMTLKSVKNNLPNGYQNFGSKLNSLREFLY